MRDEDFVLGRERTGVVECAERQFGLAVLAAEHARATGRTEAARVRRRRAPLGERAGHGGGVVREAHERDERRAVGLAARHAVTVRAANRFAARDEAARTARAAAGS